MSHRVQEEEAKQEENKVTVVIPNYNGVGYLKDCLECLMQESGLEDTPPFQVLVVDNGSADGSCTMVERQFPQVRLIALSDNTGFCHAVNVGIRASETPYVILLNNDTKIKTGFIKYLLEAIERDSGIFSVSSQMLMWDKPELVDDAGDRYCVLGWAFARGKGKAAVNYSKPAEVFAACGGAAVYRKSVFDEIGGFDEQHFAYLEDLDIGYRAKLYGYRNYYEPRAQVLHMGSASSGSRYNEFKTRLTSANSVYIIGKNMPLFQWIWNLPFFLLGFFIKFLFFWRKKMGKLYLQGLWTGLKRCFSKEGRRHKVRFCWKKLPCYLAVQWQLYCNTIRWFGKN